MKTTNGGLQWNALPSGTSHWLWSIHFVDAQTGWAVGGIFNIGTVLKTTNGGLSWNIQQSGTTNNLYSVLFASTLTGWAAGWNGTIIKTTNGGASWMIQSSGTINYFKSIHLTNANTGWMVGELGVTLKTSNGGINWVSQTSGTNKELQSIHFVNEFTGWVVGQYGLVLKTTNGGSVYISQINNNVPYKFYLYQNYPNPFNPNTKVKFQIAELSDVKLVVYDVLGREVATLVNESLKAGTYEVEFDGRELPSGVYFYKLVSDGFVDVKKMVLIN